MPGPNPKPPHLRQRTNTTSTAATLSLNSKRRGPRPKLPARGRGNGRWHPRVVAWWNDVWDSPMAVEFLEVHRHGLEALAELRQQFHLSEEPSKMLALHAEIRQAQRDYGLTPMDLRRLQWEINRADQKTAKTDRKSPKKGEDPRKMLRVLK